MPATLDIAEAVVVSGTPAHATLALSAAASEPTVVTLGSTNTAVPPVPASITVSAGAARFAFDLDTVAFVGPGDFACVNANAAGATVTDCVSVNPVPSGPAIQSVTFTPNPVGTAELSERPSQASGSNAAVPQIAMAQRVNREHPR